MPAKPTFDPTDPLSLDTQLTDDERAIRDAARAYCQKQLAPRVLEAFRHEKVDAAIFREMGAVGLLGATIPERHGGAGLNYVSYRLIARELESIDSGYRSMMSVQSSLVMLPIAEFGSEAMKEKYLRKLAKGDLIGCFGLTEPNFGSDPAGMLTRAKKVAGGWSLTGSKTWISNSPIADVFVIWAKDDDGAIRGFVLEKGAKGLSAPAIHGKIGLRTSVTGEVVMDGAFCPDENAFPDVRGLKGPFTCLDSARYGICWGAIGAAEDCYRRARQYVHGSQAIRQAARREPTDPEEARRHAHRDRARPTGVSPHGAAPRRRRGGRRDHEPVEAQQLRQGARHRARGARHARRQRHQ